MPAATAMGRALVVTIVFAASSAAAEAPSLSAMVEHLDAAAKNVETLAGQFTQRNRVKLFKQELTAKGLVYFRRPRQIRWEYVTPDPSVMILDGNRAVLRSPGAPPQEFDLDKDATMRAIFDQLLTWLGPGSLAKARDDYELQAGGTAAAPVVTLTPKLASVVGRAFSKIELRLDGKSWQLRSIMLVEKNGDEKEIVFQHLLRNTKLPENAFK
jgi:outer membrane lipoprotein-sorting protein